MTTHAFVILLRESTGPDDNSYHKLDFGLEYPVEIGTLMYKLGDGNTSRLYCVCDDCYAVDIFECLHMDDCWALDRFGFIRDQGITFSL